ncbi:MAG: hypothetical protein QM727_14570 [Niabella sp.]
MYLRILYSFIELLNNLPHEAYEIFHFDSIILSSAAIFAQKGVTVWDSKSEEKHLKNRQDSLMWDRELLQRDIESNKERVSSPIRFGAFPVPKYGLLGKESFKGMGNGGNFSGVDINGKKVLYSYFFVNRNALIQKFIDTKPNEVFFTIIVLTDFIDTVSYTHTRVHVISRNNPDYIGQGFFKTKSDEIDYTAFLTADRNGYAIVNMRLFNLKQGRIVLIAPQKDGSLRSMQIKSPILDDKELNDYIEKLLKQEDVRQFFSDPNNI